MATSVPKLADILDAKDNSFGLLRLVLALAVVVSHSFGLVAGTPKAEPLTGLAGYSLGEHAVQVFFLLSGLLVAQSAARADSVVAFAIARGLRIMPALAVCVLVTALVLGPLASALPASQYLLHPETARYIVRTVSLVSASEGLPGLFEANPAEGVVNGSLWTLKFEAACYVALALAAAAGLFRLPSAIAAAATLAFVAVFSAVLPSPPAHYSAVQNLAYFGLHFGLGTAAYLLRDHIRLSGAAAALFALPATLTIGTPLQNLTTAVFLGYGACWLATFRFAGLRRLCQRDDLSYGTYIYGMPVQQTLLVALPGLTPVSLTFFSVPVTLVLAAVSWIIIERPALAWRTPIAERYARLSAAPPAAVSPQTDRASESCPPAQGSSTAA